jgi:hypothetical protein
VKKSCTRWKSILKIKDTNVSKHIEDVRRFDMRNIADQSMHYIIIINPSKGISKKEKQKPFDSKCNSP